MVGTGVTQGFLSLQNFFLNGYKSPEFLQEQDLVICADNPF